MIASGSDPEDRHVPNTSIGYTEDKGTWRPNVDSLPYRGTSAGGGYTTVGDLLRFANALQSNSLLDAAHTQLLTEGKVDIPGGPPDNEARYAYGFFDEQQNGVRCFGHDGGAPGMNGALQICPGPGYTVIVLANMDPPPPKTSPISSRCAFRSKRAIRPNAFSQGTSNAKTVSGSPVSPHKEHAHATLDFCGACRFTRRDCLLGE